MSRAIVLLGLAACQPPLATPDAPQRDMPTDAPPPPWWTPAPGEVDGWDIQLTPNPTAPAFDLAARVGGPTEPVRTAFILNLWDIIPREMTMEYADGNVVVPAGPIGAEVEVMHARRPRPTLICRVDTGRLQLTDPDASKFPGFEATPPDDPTPPAAGSVIGWSSALPDGIRWLNIDASAHAIVKELIAKRIALAKAAGCDAILGDGNDQFLIRRDSNAGEPGDGAGFGNIDVNENITWFVEVAKLVHDPAIELSAGFKGVGQLTSSDIVGAYDFAFAERCGELEDCSTYSPFLRGEGFSPRAVLALDLNRIVSEKGQPDRGPGQFCNAQTGAGITDGIIKDEALSTAHWADCLNPSVTPMVDAGVDSQ